jgi:hypothetical protein
VQVQLKTSPPGAQLFLDVSATDPRGSFLGVSGEPFWIDLNRLRRISNLRIRCAMDGFEEQIVVIPSGYFEKQRTFPSSGTIRLQPATTAAWLRQHTGAGLFLAALLAAGLLALGRHLRSRRSSLARRAFLDSWRRPDDSMNLVLIGGWRLLERIGEGAHGTVYRAVSERELPDARPVALKLFRPGQDEDGRLTVSLTSRLLHPGLVPVLDYGTHQGRFFLVSELVEGGPLADLSRQQAGTCLLQLMEALDYLHDRGIVHGDLRPQNVILDPERGPRLIDFGRSSGDPAYLAPEALEGGRFTRAGDQFSLGVIAWELLVGEHPFQAEDLVGLMQRRYAPLPPAPACPKVARVLERMLAKNPNDRYPDIRDAAIALRRALEPA